MKRTLRPFILRLINALFPHEPTIPPRKRTIAHRHTKKTERRRIRERKPKEPKS